MPKSRPPTSKVVADQQDSEVCLEEEGSHHNRVHHQGGKRMQAAGPEFAGDSRLASGEVTLAMAPRGQNCLNQD